jgi:hypothetical protein
MEYRISHFRNAERNLAAEVNSAASPELAATTVTDPSALDKVALITYERSIIA